MKKKSGSSSNSITVNFNPTESHIGAKNIGFNYEKVNINKNIEVKSDIPTTPQECDYYFETLDDFNTRRDQIISENNNDLSQKTFGFGDGITDLSGAFSDTSITSTPKMIFARNVTDFINCFRDCIKLASISKELFDNCTEVTEFDGCFNACRNLTLIPKGLFDKCIKATSFYSCFYNCDIATIPEGLFDKHVNVTNFNYCFQHCTSLTSVPKLLFDNCPNVIYFDYCFENCYNITSALPDAWNKDKFPKVNNGIDYARNCTKASNYSEIPVDWK